ncbi:YczE/YyaS/YitT family protein [Saccharopolyspora sp. MS10]|uniref:membrane protein YczE n=1 Tax=Saccharopolyspora sp. MS10 TaxID=3385973 RepID=UPI0039A1327E
MTSTATKVDLSPVPVTVRPAARLAQLFAGLALYGTSMALMVRAEIGLSPWDVLHDGMTQRLDWSFGAITALTSVLVLALWVPLRQRPGIGTVANVVVIALSVDLVLGVLPPAHALPWQLTLIISGVVLNGLATAIYVGARLGPGPRDGLMTGLHARTGWSVRLVRSGIEVGVLVVGWFLGGSAGLGTVLYAVSIGAITQFFLPWTTVPGRR